MKKEFTENDLAIARIEGKEQVINYVWQLIKKGETTGQIACKLDIEVNILRDLRERLN